MSADPAAMRSLAGSSGGRVVDGGDVADMAAVVERWRAERQSAVDRRPAWDRSWVLGALVALLGAEWFLRRRGGLL